MRQDNSFSHSRWAHGYQVVFIPLFRHKAFLGSIRRQLREVFRRLAAQKESVMEERHSMPDFVHMMISIPPKCAVSQVIGYIKGKSAIHMGFSMLRECHFLTDFCRSGRGGTMSVYAASEAFAIHQTEFAAPHNEVTQRPAREAQINTDRRHSGNYRVR